MNIQRDALVVAGARSDAAGTAVTVSDTTDTLTRTAHGLKDGDRVYLTAVSVPSEPGGLPSGTLFFVVNKTTDTFQLARTPGGTPIDVTSAGTGVTFSRTPLEPNGSSGLHMALYGEAQILTTVDRPDDRFGITYVDSDPAVRDGAILWDADVVVLGGLEGSPLLVIGADGKVLAANAVLVRNGSGALVPPTVGQQIQLDAGLGITVAPITNGGYADIAFSARNTVVNATDTISGSLWPTFEFRDTLAGVTIVNYANRKLTLEGIDVVYDATTRTTPVVWINSAAGAIKSSTTIQFDLKHSAAPSLVDVEQRGTGDLVIAGNATRPITINNPIGLTRLANFTQSILATGGAVVSTNLFDGYAPNGTIGSLASRLQVDLVQFVARARVDGPPADGFRPSRVLVDAGTDAFLSLRGVDRANFTGVVTASGNAITRTDGKSWWLVNGFQKGDVIALADGTTRTVTDVSGSVLTLDSAVAAGTVSILRTEIAVGIDHIKAGRDIDLELRTGVRQTARTTTADIEVRVVSEPFGSRWNQANPLTLHRFHFRGLNTDCIASNLATCYDPRPAGASAILDPAIYAAMTTTPPTPAKAVEIEIDSRYTFKLLSATFTPSRSDVTIPFLNVKMLKAETADGEFLLYTTASAGDESPGLIAGRHMDIRDTEGLAAANDLAPTPSAPTRSARRLHRPARRPGRRDGLARRQRRGQRQPEGDGRRHARRPRPVSQQQGQADRRPRASSTPTRPRTGSRAPPTRRTSRATRSCSWRSPARSAPRPTSSRPTSTTRSRPPACSTPTAPLGIYLWEVAGDLRIGLVDANKAVDRGTRPRPGHHRRRARRRERLDPRRPRRRRAPT